MAWWWSFEIIYQTLDARIGIKELLVVLLIMHFINFLSVITKTRNEAKQPETSPNDQKKLRNDPKWPKISTLGKSGILLAFVFQTLNPNAQIWVFWAKKYQLFNLLTKYCLYFILKVLIWNLTLFFEIFKPKCPYLGFLGQKVSSF